MASKPTHSDRPKKILLIEDDLSLLDNTREILELHGFAVLTAPSARKGIEILEHATPDLILCDICMPGPNGHLVLHYAKKSPENGAIPFLFFSAQAEKQDITEALEAGADGYVLKPFLIPDLIETLKKHLKQPKKNVLKQKTRARELELLPTY